MENIEKFKKEVDKLQQLLNEDEQGMGTWWGFLHKRMENLCELYYGYKPSTIRPKK